MGSVGGWVFLLDLTRGSIRKFAPHQCVRRSGEIHARTASVVVPESSRGIGRRPRPLYAHLSLDLQESEYFGETLLGPVFGC